MKKLILFTVTILALIVACSSNEDEYASNTDITINFSHNWDGNEVTKDDFNDIKFVNANGNRLSIEQLRYLISDIYLENDSGITTQLKDYLLVDLGKEENLTFSTEKLLLNGTYDAYITFGFADSDTLDVDADYADLTTANFGVPEALGGGFHHMQFDGKYTNNLDEETAFNYHAIRATNLITTTADSDDFLEKDTSILVDLGEVYVEDNTLTINIQMDISEWFTKDIGGSENWDLDINNTGLMGNYYIQIAMEDYGTSVFSLVEEEEEE